MVAGYELKLKFLRTYIRMLAPHSQSWMVNSCKVTNETRSGIDATEASGHWHCQLMQPEGRRCTEGQFLHPHANPDPAAWLPHQEPEIHQP